ncbi:GatB/YqeY domain-containing protein [Pelagibacteraceae bacterium]|nr:GatB/YqeY domain-containing protein [Pelagibacteraceae bacterium]
MSLRNKIDEDYKQSIKNKDQQKVDTLRLIRSAIKDKDISTRTSENKEGINDAEILSLLINLIKQRKDSIEQFQKAKRDDLIINEQSEIEIINEYLPQQKTQEETEKIINEIITTNNLESIKDMGKVMSIIKNNYAGEVDMGLVGKIAKSKLVN